MRRAAIIAAACGVLAASPCAAGDLTVEQCLSILGGLRALNCAGQQLGGSCPPPPDGKQYKLGDARLPIALDTSALDPVSTSYQRAVQGHQLEFELLPPPPAPTDASKQDPFAAERLKQARDFSKYSLDQLEATCPVKPGHIKWSDLKVGDGSEQNAIPPGVLGAISPIVDGTPDVGAAAQGK